MIRIELTTEQLSQLSQGMILLAGYSGEQTIVVSVKADPLDKNAIGDDKVSELRKRFPVFTPKQQERLDQAVIKNCLSPVQVILLAEIGGEMGNYGADPVKALLLSPQRRPIIRMIVRDYRRAKVDEKKE